MTATLSPKERDALRRLAEKATPGPWRTVTNRPFGPWVNEDCNPPRPADGNSLFVRNWKDACLNAAYIAACSPDRILALLDDHARLTVALQAATTPTIFWDADDMEMGYNDVQDCADGLSVGEVMEISCAAHVPNIWAARIPDSYRVAIFATEAEARDAISALPTEDTKR